MRSMELAADLADYFRDWVDGDDPVASVDFEPFDGDGAQMGVTFESGDDFVLLIVSP